MASAADERMAYAAYKASKTADMAASGDFLDLLAPESAETRRLRGLCADYLAGRLAADDEIVSSADSLEAARRQPPAGASAAFCAGWIDRFGDRA